MNSAGISIKSNVLIGQVNIQAVCDHEKRFTSYDMGWPGSVTVLKHSHLWNNRATYFNGDEYILADRGQSEIETWSM